MRSLGLDWLRKHDRTLVVPQVVYVEKAILPGAGTECGGFYIQPGQHEIQIGDCFFDACFGLLVVTADDKNDGRSTLAHEWRHHWQRHNGMPFDHQPFAYPQKPYETAIREFFRSSKSEMDALQFEAYVAPSDLNDYWLSLACE